MPSGVHFSLDSLPERYRVQVAEKLAPSVSERDVGAKSVEKSSRKVVRRKKVCSPVRMAKRSCGMNATEKRFQGEILLGIGKYEAFTLHLSGGNYTPDFVFETETEKWLCEVKAVGKVEEPVVQAKKEAALKWCHYASEGVAPGGKRWRYMLVPDTAINSSLELAEAMRVYGAL